MKKYKTGKDAFDLLDKYKNFLSFDNYYYGIDKERKVCKDWEKYIIKHCGDFAVNNLTVDDPGYAVKMTTNYEKCAERHEKEYHEIFVQRDDMYKEVNKCFASCWESPQSETLKATDRCIEKFYI